MADDRMNSIMQDLQNQLQNANLSSVCVSSIAKKGDEKLVQQFLSESVLVPKSTNLEQRARKDRPEVLSSQLYIACFWGFKDIVKGILQLAKEEGHDIDVNHRNKGTLWTPLHAATFQEHGPIVMMLLSVGADPNTQDAEGRTPKDFASASDKVWGHFATIGLNRTSRSQLTEMGIIKLGMENRSSREQSAGQGIRMASYSPDTSDASDHFYQDAASGDVLANQAQQPNEQHQPHFNVYK